MIIVYLFFFFFTNSIGLDNIASPNSPSFSVPEINSPTTLKGNEDLMFASIDTTQSSQDMFDATWLYLNQSDTQTKGELNTQINTSIIRS